MLNFIKMINRDVEYNGSLLWGALKGSNQIIGTICLWNFSKDRRTAEVGYDVGAEY